MRPALVERAVALVAPHMDADATFAYRSVVVDLDVVILNALN